MKYYILLISTLCCIANLTFAQQNNEKIYASGYSRAAYNNQNMQLSGGEEDTVTSKKLNSGHVLVDLTANIRPNEVTEIVAMIRVRNDFGGFYGSGVTFDVRQLYLKGIAGGRFRYQLGDFNYRLTPYTYYNNTEETALYEPKMYKIYRNMVHQDLFYNYNNSWRQQGGAVDFGFKFEKYIQEADFSVIGSSVNLVGGDGMLDRVFMGFSSKITQSKYLKLGFTYVNMFDLMGTSQNNQALRNPVTTVSMELTPVNTREMQVKLKTEVGGSKQFTANDSVAQDLSDFFIDLKAQLYLKKYHLKAQLGYINVGPEFRSPGAQSKRILYNNRSAAYSFYGNQQYERPITMHDLMQDVSLYNMKLSTSLMAYNPSYNNTTPYGTATPNRQGITGELTHTDKNKRWEARLGAMFLQEIVGTGSTDLKSFTKLYGEAVVHVNKFLKTNKTLDLHFGYHNETTTRNQSSPTAGVYNVNLNSSMLNLGLTYELIKDIELLAGYRYLQSGGIEYVPYQNSAGKVVSYNLYNVNLTESMVGGGFNYVISKDINLALLYHVFTWDDAFRAAPAYTIRQGSINYIMNF